MSNKIAEMKIENDEYIVEFESSLAPSTYAKMQIATGLEMIEERLEFSQNQIEKYNAEIDRLTNHADGIDNMIAVASGILTGLLDVILVGTWDFGAEKAQVSEQINKSVIDYAKKHPKFDEYYTKHRTTNNDLECAIKFLEKEFILPGDGNYTQFSGDGITHKTHHLDDICHHPNLIGLIACIVVQFSGFTKYHGVKGATTPVPVMINEYGNFVSEEVWGKFLAGIINWFFKAGQTIANRKGHLMSDIAGTARTAGAGAGLPGPVMSLLKEISAIPFIHSEKFSEELRKAYQNGIGTGKKQVDLGVFNGLFDGASSKVDYRTEMAFANQLKKQASVVILNEIIVRATYFIRYFIKEIKEKHSIMEVDWNTVLPFKNRTIIRMLTISLGAFEAVDLTEAAIHGVVKSGGTTVGFASEFILHVNFVGVGRFAIAVTSDASMGIKRAQERSKRIKAISDRIQLLDAKLYYNQANMWIAAGEAKVAIDELNIARMDAVNRSARAMVSIKSDVDNMGENVAIADEKNPGLIEGLLNILTEEGI